MALDTLVVFAASYENQDDAVADYEAVHEYYKSAGLIDTYDAAVITREDDGKVKVVKNMSNPPARVGGRAWAWASWAARSSRSSPQSRSPEGCWSEAQRAPGSGRSPDTLPAE